MGSDCRIKKDEESIHNIIGTIKSMIDPWSCAYDDLVSLSSGTISSEETTRDLLNAKNVGEEKLMEFINTRAKDDSSKVFDTIKQTKLKTFATTNQKMKSKVSQRQVQLERSMFALMILVAKSRARAIDM